MSAAMTEQCAIPPTDTNDLSGWDAFMGAGKKSKVSPTPAPASPGDLDPGWQLLLNDRMVEERHCIHCERIWRSRHGAKGWSRCPHCTAHYSSGEADALARIMIYLKNMRRRQEEQQARLRVPATLPLATEMNAHVMEKPREPSGSIS